MNMVNTTYNLTEDMIIKLQQLKGKTKLKFYKNISNYYHEVKNKNFHTQQDPFAKNVENMNITYHDFYYTVLKTRYENKDIHNR